MTVLSWLAGIGIQGMRIDWELYWCGCLGTCMSKSLSLNKRDWRDFSERKCFLSSLTKESLVSITMMTFTNAWLGNFRAQMKRKYEKTKAMTLPRQYSQKASWQHTRLLFTREKIKEKKARGIFLSFIL